MKHKHRYLTRVDGANAVVIMLSTVACCWDELQVDRFIKCMGEWEGAKDEGSFGLQAS